MNHISNKDRKEEMFQIIEAFQESGQSRKVFCSTRSALLAPEWWRCFTGIINQAWL
jgi:hypothetical protein